MRWNSVCRCIGIQFVLALVLALALSLSLHCNSVCPCIGIQFVLALVLSLPLHWYSVCPCIASFRRTQLYLMTNVGKITARLCRPIYERPAHDKNDTCGSTRFGTSLEMARVFEGRLPSNTLAISSDVPNRVEPRVSFLSCAGRSEFLSERCAGK